MINQPNPARLQTVLTGLKAQFKPASADPGHAEPTSADPALPADSGIKSAPESVEYSEPEERQRKTLCRHIGQAHLIPGLSWAKIEGILAEMGIDDWNLCDLATQGRLAARIEAASRP